MPAASPAVTRATTMRRPSSSHCPTAANRRSAASSARCSCRAGSASATLASATSRTRDADSVAIIRAMAWSTTQTRSSGSSRESLATLRATHTSACPDRHTAQVAGRRWTRSSTSAIAWRVATVTGAAGQRDLTQAEVLHPRRALPADLTQHLADPPRMRLLPRRQPLQRVRAMDRRPLRHHLQVDHLRQPTRPHRVTRRGQQAGGRDVTEIGGHAPILPQDDANRTYLRRPVETKSPVAEDD